VWLLEQNDFVKQWRSISMRRRVKMIGIEATLATRERAKALGLSFPRWERMMFDACLLDYRDLSRRAGKLSRLLEGNAHVWITTPGGTDLRLRLAGRVPEFSDGLATEKVAKDGGVVYLPPGFVGTTVDEKSAEGTVAYDSPIRFPEGTVEKLTLKLKSGRITSCDADSDIEVFGSVLRKTEGDVDRFSYFGIGLNPKMQLGFAQDDRVLGSVELNFGANQHRGGKNRGDRNWWGTVKRATIMVGGRKVMENGSMLV
jgi:leucyl aminopeptidase (aminopeptidase T)